MNGTRRISHGARRRRNGAALDLRPPRFSRPQFSNRQNPLIGSGLSCCKQTLRARSNRQIFRGSGNFCFHISNFGDSFGIAVPLVPRKAEGSEHREPRDLSVSSISTRQCFQVESAATRSKQTIGARLSDNFSAGRAPRSPARGAWEIRPATRFSNFQFRISPFQTQKQVSRKTSCFSPQVFQNKRSAPKSSVNFSRSVFRPNFDFSISSSSLY